MDEEIKALREEVAKLRERIAVLEAMPVYQPAPMFVGPGRLPPYRVVPMTEPPYYVGDAPGWWQQGPMARVTGTTVSDASNALRN